MVKYMCHNCNDLPFGHITSVLEHIWSEHGIEVQKYHNITGFRCAECKTSFKSIVFFLKHMDKTHGIHIWYEKGLTRKRIFFDGILKDDMTKEDRRAPKAITKKERKAPRDSWAMDDWNSVPLSKRPFEPRKKDSDEEGT